MLAKYKIKVKVTIEQAMKAQRRADIQLYSSFNLCGRWGVDGQSHAAAAPRAGLDGCGKSRPPPGFDSPDRPARSESLYRLSCRWSKSKIVILIKQRFGVISCIFMGQDSTDRLSRNVFKNLPLLSALYRRRARFTAIW